MRQALAAVAMVALILLFLVANRGAYEGSFFDDDLDNISWTRGTPISTFLTGLVSPRYYTQHFRPVGHLTFGVLGRTAGLDYRYYVATVHVLHGLTTVALYFLLRRLGFEPFHAASGTLFFFFPVAAFDALWKPMYLFDVWCGLLSVLTLLAWTSGRLWLSALFLLLAYKAKEQAVMLPFVLAVYEHWFGQKRWRPVLALVAVAGVFAVQAVIHNSSQGGDYRIQISPASLAQTLFYYAARILLFPYLGLLILVMILRLVPDRRMWFGMASCALLLGPMLVLPNRMSTAYLYVPLAALAIALAATFARAGKILTVAILAVWFGQNYQELRHKRKEYLTLAHENRRYVETLRHLASEQPAMRRFLYDGFPEALRPWGIQGALRIVYQADDVVLHSVEMPDLTRLFESGPVALLHWNAPLRELDTVVRAPGEPDKSYLQMARVMPIWQLESGWYQAEGKFRWAQPVAVARLWRPAGVREFVLEVNVGPGYIKAVKQAQVRVRIDGQEVGAAEFRSHGWQTVTFPLPPADPGTALVELRTDPAYRPSASDPRVLGSAVGGLGFR
jgi:hypothetical protein